MSTQTKQSIEEIFGLQPRSKMLDDGADPSAGVPLAHKYADPSSQDRLTPTRGLLFGLAIAALLWTGIVGLAWALRQ